jgi:RNA polymerase sigma-70 factor (ECF subfamily)
VALPTSLYEFDGCQEVDLGTHRDERLLVERVRLGDPLAFEAIFRAYHLELRQLAARIVGSLATAEDVVQEVFLAVWRGRERWRVASSLSAYLRRSVRNMSIRYAQCALASAAESIAATGGLNRGSPEGSRLANVLELVDRSPSPQENAEGAALAAEVDRVAATLSPRTSEVFNLSRREQLSNREIAERLEISLKTVEMHLTRALSALRSALTPWLRS